LLVAPVSSPPLFAPPSLLSPRPPAISRPRGAVGDE
jgi:hypothetical protein